MTKPNPFIRILLTTVGSVSVILGILGMFLPILPTTPFMLLSAYCFCRSSPRLYVWLMAHPSFGFKLYSYRVTHGMTRRAKWQIWILLWLSIGVSMILVPHWWLRILLFIIALGVSCHIASLNTISDADKESHYAAYIHYRTELKQSLNKMKHPQ